MTKMGLLVAVLSLGCAGFDGLVLQEDFESGDSDSDARPDIEVRIDGADDARPDIVGEVGIDSGADTIVVAVDTFVGADADADAGDTVDACTPISHSNGLGQTYLDCAPLGTPGVASTYTEAMANKARAAWPFAGVDSALSCSGSPDVLMRYATGKGCAIWGYASDHAGRVRFSSAIGDCTCSSPTATWN